MPEKVKMRLERKQDARSSCRSLQAMKRASGFYSRVWEPLEDSKDGLL